MKLILQGKPVNARPIHFSREMRDSYRSGRKTQTRRKVRCAYAEFELGTASDWNAKKNPEMPSFESFGSARGLHVIVSGTAVAAISCPFGKPGDWLWVHEPVYVDSSFGHLCSLYYLDNGGKVTLARPERVKKPKEGAWKGRTLPAEWARDWLRIEEIKAPERVRDISEADIRAEGVKVVGYGDYPDEFSGKNLWCALWSRVNGSASWMANPWVWPIRFTWHRIPPMEVRLA